MKHIKNRKGWLVLCWKMFKVDVLTKNLNPQKSKRYIGFLCGKLNLFYVPNTAVLFWQLFNSFSIWLLNPSMDSSIDRASTWYYSCRGFKSRQGTIFQKISMKNSKFEFNRICYDLLSYHEEM